MFRWINKDQGNKVATIYDTNITLNKPSSVYFNHAFAVMLGVNESTHQLAIKPLTKEMYERGDIDKEMLYKISVRSSYARISNKTLIKEISALFPLDFGKQKMFKFKCDWVENEKSLVIDFNQPVEVNHGHRN